MMEKHPNLKVTFAHFFFSSKEPEYLEGLYQLDALDELLPQMDFVAVTLPAYQDTDGLFTKERMMKMKQSGILINVGRGSLVDNIALAELLNEGSLGGALIDVGEISAMLTYAMQVLMSLMFLIMNVEVITWIVLAFWGIRLAIHYLKKDAESRCYW